MNKFIAVIPCYRHENTLFNVIQDVKKYVTDIVVVDDGNSADAKQKILDIAKEFENVFVIHNKVNSGKGASVAVGIHFAACNNYTHAIQIDADGQHNTSDIEKLLKMSEQYPDCAISGYPEYSDDAPKSRVIGRKITNFFVHIETLSTMIKDAMIGFRAYPVAITDKIIQKHKLKARMTFDIEILVHLAWNGVKIRYFNTKVIYPENGISNFKASDNFKISWMHTKLCTYSILTLPVRIFKNAR